MKNCDLFVLGPELAMLKIPRSEWVRCALNSSLNSPPKMSRNPVPCYKGVDPKGARYRRATHFGRGEFKDEFQSTPDPFCIVS